MPQHTDAPRRQSEWPRFGLVLLSVLGCQGTIIGNPATSGTGAGNSGVQPGSDPGSTGGGAGAADPGNPPVEATGTIHARTWRLNKLNYANAIRQIGLNPDAAIAKFPDDTQGAPFVASTSLNVQQVLAEKYADAAEQIGNLAQAQGESYFKRFASCTWTDSACVDTFLRNLGRMLYRQPLAAEQITRLKAIFNSGTALSSPAEGMKYALQAMLQSPAFLYRTEVGPSTVSAGSNEAVTLTSFETASLLAFMMTDAPPDTELSRAADADELKTNVQIRAQFERLNKTPDAISKTASFLEALFGVNALLEVPKDQTLFPNASVVQANLQLSFRSDLKFFLSSPDTSWSAAMRTSRYSVNGATGAVFGVANLSAPEFVRLEMASTERRGLLTHPAVMAALSHASESAPVPRGKMVLARLLCRPPASPPANAETMLNQDQLPPTATRRQIFDSLIARPACAGCHTSLNGIGFSLDSYDAMGKFRISDSKGALDVKGEVVGLQGGVTKDTYQGGAALAELLAGSKVAKECVSLQSYRYFLGLPNADTTIDLDSRSSFVSQGALLGQVSGMILTTRNFRERVK
jgi:Protein of unknown function (DUF1588)/Protein of unknown function (DUF1592)/Protein of unknown function (DUF1595)/Protein of unknown function (DUF1587)